MGRILFLLLMTSILCIGCATEAKIPADQIWPDDKYMVRLEREVIEICSNLVSGITPDSIAVSWQDNLRPHSPMMSEAYIVSMIKRHLTRLGFSVFEGSEPADYSLMIVMTPSRQHILVRARISHRGRVIATQEAYLDNSSEKWNKALCSYRYRTKVIIPVGGQP